MSFQGKLEKDGVSSIKLFGRNTASALAGTSADILVLLRDNAGKILFASGTDVPTGTTTGYAKGCLFIDRDVATGSPSLYENIGTDTSCNFNLIGAISAGEITIANTKILIGSAAGVGAAFALSGDATMTNGGVVTVTKSTGDFVVAGGDLDAGSSGVAGSVDVFPTTASKGKVSITCTDQTGDTTVSVVVGAMGQATTVNISDPGVAASYLLQSTAAITLAEADVLDGAIAGTVVASKAVVVDASKDIGDFRNLDAVNIDAGVSGTAGSIDIFPGTASKGKLSLACTDQTGDTTVTLNANAMGQGTTVNVADPGAAASYLAQSTAALTLAEVDVLDGATAGTQVASKAVVADANINTGVSKVTELHIGATGSETQVNATAAEINEACDKSAGAAVSLTGTVSLTQALHAGKVCTLDAVAGFTATLPEATGTGDIYTIIVGTALTSNSYVIATADAANADICGVARGQDMDDDTVTNFAAQQGDGFDLITLNRTTTGGVNVAGDRITLIDVDTDVWRCDMDYMVPTGSNPATPFSST